MWGCLDGPDDAAAGSTMGVSMGIRGDVSKGTQVGSSKRHSMGPVCKSACKRAGFDSRLHPFPLRPIPTYRRVRRPRPRPRPVPGILDAWAIGRRGQCAAATARHMPCVRCVPRVTLCVACRCYAVCRTLCLQHIKQRIEDLIQREFLERNKDQSQVYNYLA